MGITTTVYEDDLQRLYYDHDDDAFYLETSTPTDRAKEMTREEAEDFLKLAQTANAFENFIDRFDEQ